MMKALFDETRVWIFDWSGTLADDLTPTLQATNAVLRRYGSRELGLEEFREHFRLPYNEFYEEWLPGVELGELEDHFRAAFEPANAHIALLPGARDILRELQERKGELMILSSMDARCFELQARRLEVWDFFSEVHAGVLDKRVVLREILRRRELDPREVVFVGDMCHDLEAARETGVAGVGLLTGYDRREVLEGCEPVALFEDLGGLRERLAGEWALEAR